ncbi:MAG: hypothetical protein HON68_01990 [Gammaproteobacteria bacterium]|nr:hypothetical protein [Gammaproteobacteria bacterium]MBT3473750.1 hypothetical protein [Gammaproteobacteria bacterium]MBT3488662.1 hypothetical protein [Gammaproteobacteria bacterium]MBT3717519.1 hypothetical protein [Gammaproteobacteria bacterium]MBT3844707.1 hypothetical protein [Gammaproteobacteria bacterium]
MQSITININNDQLVDKVTWLLEHFRKDGLEIVSREDIDDLKLLKATRGEESIPFDEYLKHED